ncbi:MAG: hypothetical protein GY716_10550 [bacterium]|nr:hypothetical protein [bacterium]
MKHRLVAKVVLILSALSLPILPVHAEEGRIPIFEPVVLNGADASGKFILTRNITASGIVVQVIGTGTEVMDLDLNGFSIVTSGFNMGVVVSNVLSFTIRNGSITSSGSDQVNVTTAAVSNSSVVIEDLKLRGGGFASMFVTNAAHVEVRRNFVEGLGNGLFLDSSSIPSAGIIEDNVMRNLAEYGIDQRGSATGLTIRGNLVDINLPGGAGIATDDITDSLIVDNSVTHQSVGILVNGDTNTIDNNRVRGTNDMGIFSETGIKLFNSKNCTVTNNVTTGHFGTGIDVILSDGNRIERNASNDNGWFGIRLHGSNNRYGRNTAWNNAGGVACGGATCGTPDFCNTGVGNVSFGDNLMPGLPPC